RPRSRRPSPGAPRSRGRVSSISLNSSEGPRPSPASGEARRGPPLPTRFARPRARRARRMALGRARFARGDSRSAAIRPKDDRGQGASRNMLVLTRRLGEVIRVGDAVTVRVLEVKGNQVRLGVEAPPEVRIYR